MRQRPWQRAVFMKSSFVYNDVVGKPSPQLMDIKEMSMSKEKGSKKDNTRCNCMVINLYDVKEN